MSVRTFSIGVFPSQATLQLSIYLHKYLITDRTKFKLKSVLIIACEI